MFGSPPPSIVVHGMDEAQPSYLRGLNPTEKQMKRPLPEQEKEKKNQESPMHRQSSKGPL